MIFDVKASKGKRVLYFFVNAMMILFLLFWVRVLFGILEEQNTVGGLIFLAIIWTSLAALFVYAIYTVIYTMHLVVTVDGTDKTLTIKKLLRRPITISVYDITSWKVKIVNGKHGEASRNLFIDYEGGRIRVSSLLEHWEKLRLFLVDNASDKLNGDLGKEETGYSYLSKSELDELIKETENIPLTYEQEIAHRASQTLHDLLPYNYLVDCMLFKSGQEPLQDAFKACLKKDWIDESQREILALLDDINFEIQREDGPFEDFIEGRLSGYDISHVAIRKQLGKLLDSLSKDIGQPVNFYSAAEPLSAETCKALCEIIVGENIEKLFFIEFPEYVLSVLIDRFD